MANKLLHVICKAYAATQGSKAKLRPSLHAVTGSKALKVWRLLWNCKLWKTKAERVVRVAEAPVLC